MSGNAYNNEINDEDKQVSSSPPTEIQQAMVHYRNMSIPQHSIPFSPLTQQPNIYSG
mgnify:CR=1 FL=1